MRRMWALWQCGFSRALCVARTLGVCRGRVESGWRLRGVTVIVEARALPAGIVVDGLNARG